MRIYISIIIIFFFNNVFGNLKTPSQIVVHQKEFDQVHGLIIDNRFDDAIKILDGIKLEELDSIIYYINYAQISVLKKDFSKSSYYINEAEKIAKKTPDQLDDAYVYYGKGKIGIIYNQNIKPTSNFLKAINILKNYKNQESYIGYCYYYLSYIHTKVRLYSSEYKNYIEQSLKYANETNNLELLMSALNEQTLLYELEYNDYKKKDDLDKLFSIMDKLKTIITNPKNKEKIVKKYTIVFYNNLASYINTLPYQNLSQNERAKIAEKYIIKAENELKKSPTLNHLYGLIYITHGEIKLNLNDKKAAEEYYLKVYSNINNFMGDEIYFYRLATSLLSNLYRDQGRYKEALKFKEEEYKYSIQSYKQQADDKTKYLEASFNTEQKNQQIKQLEEKNKIYSKQRFLHLSIVILSIFGLIFLSYMLYYKIKSNKQKTNLLEAERYEAELNLQLEKEEKARIKAEQELLELQQEQLNKQALATSLQLKQKNSFLNDLKEKAKEKEVFNLDRILKDERLIDDDFNEIQNIVKEVHPNFFNKLNEVSKSKLTNLDLKYAAYLYLNMDNMQIANLMKVETKTVRMAKYRMKQKIGLNKENDLQNFLQNLIK